MAIVTLTPKAVEKAVQMTKGKDVYIKFGIRKGGCSGFMYDIGYTTEVQNGDEVLSESGMRVIVPKDAKEFLKGSTIDFKDSLLGAGFKIENPNVTKSCKCGHSIR